MMSGKVPGGWTLRQRHEEHSSGACGRLREGGMDLDQKAELGDGSVEMVGPKGRPTAPEGVIVPAHAPACRRGKPPADSGAMSEDAKAKAEAKADEDAQRAEATNGCMGGPGCLARLHRASEVLYSDESPPVPARPKPPPQAPGAVSAATWTDGEWPFTIQNRGRRHIVPLPGAVARPGIPSRAASSPPGR